MTTIPGKTYGFSSPLWGILLDYMLSVDATVMPGCDGMTVEDALTSYPLAARNGYVPDREELVRRCPDLRREIDAFFSQSSR